MPVIYKNLPPCPYPATPSGAEARLIDMIMAWYQGKYQEVICWLRAVGCKVDKSGEGAWTVKGLTGITCGIMEGMSPIDSFAMFGFMLAGPYWPQVFPNVPKEVDKRYKALRKASEVRNA